MIQDTMPDTDPSPASSLQNVLTQHPPKEQVKKAQPALRLGAISLSNSPDSLVTSSSSFLDEGIASPAVKQSGARLGVAGSPRLPSAYPTAPSRTTLSTSQAALSHRKRGSVGSLAELDRDSPFSEESGDTATATERTPQKASVRQRTHSMQRAWTAYPFEASSSTSDDLDLTDYQSRRASMPAAITPSVPKTSFDQWSITALVESLSSPDSAGPVLGKVNKAGSASPGDRGLRRLKSTPVGEQHRSLQLGFRLIARFDQV